MGCFAHVRRKFDEALKAQGKNPAKQDTIAHQAMMTIQKLYRIEADIKHLPPEQKLLIRPSEVLSGILYWLILKEAFNPVGRLSQSSHMLIGSLA